MQLNGESTLSFIGSENLTLSQGSGFVTDANDSGLSFMQMLESIQNTTAREGTTLENKNQENAFSSSKEISKDTKTEEFEERIEKEDDEETKESKKTSQTLSEEEIAYLFMKDKSEAENEFDIPLEEYTAIKTNEELLSDAQKMSLENPEDFLNTAEETFKNLNVDFSDKMLSKKINIREDESDKKTASLLKSNKNTKQVFTLVDQRTKKLNDTENTKSVKKVLNTKVSSQSSNQIELTVTLNQNAQNNILSSDSQTAASNGSNFQAMLTEQLQHNAPDFVKAGTVVLKDNNQGTINMILKPESLGNVKVKLNLSDKVITGEITVHSQEAYDAFKESIGSLKEAFQQSGFETAGFELNLASDGSNQNHGSATEGQQQDAGYQFYSDQVYGELVENQSSSSDSFEKYEGKSIYTVDFVA